MIKYILLLTLLGGVLPDPGRSQSKLVGPGRPVDPFRYQVRKTSRDKGGCVVSAHPLASEVGLAILKEGGNAIDAAIATQLALAVVYPAAGNIGGGGFMVIHTASGKDISIDFRERAPGLATRDMYLDSAGNPNPRWSRYGRRSVGVPGTIAGIFRAYAYARLPFRELIQPAIDLAEHGFTLTGLDAGLLNQNQQDLLRYNRVIPPLVKPGGWRPGDTLVQKDLARTLRSIRDQGMAGFYRGQTARLIVAEMKRGKGLISLKDLAGYRALLRAPIRFTYRGYTVVSMPLPSSGGIMLQQMLGMLEPYPIARWGFESLRSVQLMTEIERRSFADRAKYLGDPDFFPVPVRELTSPAYLKQRMKDYSPDSASPSQDIRAGTLNPEDKQTTHMSIVDYQGNAVSMTYTLNNLFGSKVMVAGAGFLLNDEMDDFSAKPGSPNMFGLTGAEVNAIQPFKRMLSSMTPTLVLKNGRVFLVAGSPGGATIITSVFQTLVDILDFQLNPVQAVDAPKFHHQWLPDLVDTEPGFPALIIGSMEKMGYHFRQVGSIGRTDIIERDPDGTLTGVGDRRGEDTALGF